MFWNKSVDNVELAYELFNCLSLGSGNGGKYDKQVKKIISSCESRQDILDKVIELCGEPVDAKTRYILAMAYSWSTVKYREKAIEYIELYLNNELYEDAYKNSFVADHLDMSLNKRKEIHLSKLYRDLGSKYEGIYDFDRAFSCYEKSQEYAPIWAFGYYDMSNIMVKKNQLEKAKQILLEARNHVFDDNVTTQNVISSKIMDIDKKIRNNYVYKPRKKKDK